MASRFVIREKAFGGFCTSQKYASFSTDLQEAALYASRENAQKAVKNMFVCRSDQWSIVDAAGTVRRYYTAELQAYIEEVESLIRACDSDDVCRIRHLTELVTHLRENAVELPCDMEVVEVKLTIV